MIESSKDFLGNWIAMQQTNILILPIPQELYGHDWPVLAYQQKSVPCYIRSALHYLWWKLLLCRQKLMPLVNMEERQCCARHQSISQPLKHAWLCLEITRKSLTTNCGTKRRGGGLHRWTIRTPLRIVGQQLMQFWPIFDSGIFNPNKTHTPHVTPLATRGQAQVKPALL